MTFTKDEKKLLCSLLDEHLEEVKKTEKFANTPPAFLAGELSYEEFVKKLKEKLK